MLEDNEVTVFSAGGGIVVIEQYNDVSGMVEAVTADVEELIATLLIHVDKN